jgi:hypothetical protein
LRAVGTTCVFSAPSQSTWPGSTNFTWLISGEVFW